ncbi:MAG: hypothetical protein Ct9H300mP15_28700 [Gemmatimonadota bacterium]|nr:MAG: hypothetical protein Ct9H300mP15_28700 [Gemmatimonadota bacterium]
MGEMYEKAKELGNALARTDEYRLSVKQLILQMKTVN